MADSPKSPPSWRFIHPPILADHKKDAFRLETRLLFLFFVFQAIVNRRSSHWLGHRRFSLPASMRAHSCAPHPSHRAFWRYFTTMIRMVSSSVSPVSHAGFVHLCPFPSIPCRNLSLSLPRHCIPLSRFAYCADIQCRHTAHSKSIFIS